MRLVLCDGNRLLCEALGAVLEERGHKVLAIATSTDAGIASVRENEPDACLLALHFARPPDGLATARAILQDSPGTAVVILSSRPERAAVSEALRIGVSGFLDKEHDAVEVADALEVVESGGVAVAPSLIGGSRPERCASRHEQPDYDLTPREWEVLGRMVAGQSTTQMTHSMNITPSTLRTYVRNVLGKLGVHSRLQAVALATREQLLANRVE
jgi:two-component system nitrate/nitrite response regulator NarL